MLFNTLIKSSSGVMILLVAAIGVGIGIVASKIVNGLSKRQSKVDHSIKQQSTISINKTTIDNYDDLQELMVCPITQQIMTDPYILTPCGHSFEKQFIKNWLQKCCQCPLCKINATKDDMKANYHLRSVIHRYQYNKNHGQTEKKEQIGQN